MSSRPDYDYGKGPDQIDEFFRAKRSWSEVKDTILRNYIVCYSKTVPSLRRPVVVVDGFAGPGRFGDGAPGSPKIICESVSQHFKDKTGVSCLFADTRPGHRIALERNLAEYVEQGIATRPFSNCEEAVSQALKVGVNCTIFFYLDPYGIKDLDFDMVKQIYERTRSLSTEALINFNFRTFMRMSGNWRYGDSASEVSRKVKEGKTDTVNKVMGGSYWQGIITDPNLSKIERENTVVGAYLKLVRNYLPFAYAIPVKERNEDERGVPDDELARYHLIFATRSPRAIVYMNDVALNALDPYLRQFKDGLLFDLTPERYQATDRNKVKAALVESVRTEPLTRPEIWDLVVPKFFMNYKKKEYRAMIDELVREGRLFPDPRTMKTANTLNEGTRLSAASWPGTGLF